MCVYFSGKLWDKWIFWKSVLLKLDTKIKQKDSNQNKGSVAIANDR